mmetsp:Transcript_933/g.2588  ORF Transcript_933/g.2588 Transcript_933/m.2588 type:complete len:371 (-) Transcript_933:209-1321(-)
MPAQAQARHMLADEHLVVVSIEHCTASRPSFSLKGSSQAYTDHVTALRSDLEDVFGAMVSEEQIVVKVNDPTGRPPPPPAALAAGASPRGPLVWRPRIGSFEVEYALKAGPRIVGSGSCYSKIASKKFPNTSKLSADIFNKVQTLLAREDRVDRAATRQASTVQPQALAQAATAFAQEEQEERDRQGDAHTTGTTEDLEAFGRGGMQSEKAGAGETGGGDAAEGAPGGEMAGQVSAEQAAQEGAPEALGPQLAHADTPRADAKLDAGAGAPGESWEGAAQHEVPQEAGTADAAGHEHILGPTGGEAPARAAALPLADTPATMEVDDAGPVHAPPATDASQAAVEGNGHGGGLYEPPLPLAPAPDSAEPSG